VHPDDEVCLCFHVSLRKIRTYMAREDPPVASLISECLSAGTGCQWCVPFLKHLHTQHAAGQTPDLKVSPEQYVKARLTYHKTNERDPEVVREATGAGVASAQANVVITLAGGAEAPALCEPILRSVPEWFGIEEATQVYIRRAGELPTWIAHIDGAPAGFISIDQPFPRAADIFCIAVQKDLHGRGVGTAMVRHVEESLRGRGVEYLQVKTMGPSKPNAAYARTMHFYEKCGFVPLEELHGVWPGLPCLILVKRL